MIAEMSGVVLRMSRHYGDAIATAPAVRKSSHYAKHGWWWCDDCRHYAVTTREYWSDVWASPTRGLNPVGDRQMGDNREKRMMMDGKWLGHCIATVHQRSLRHQTCQWSVRFAMRFDVRNLRSRFDQSLNTNLWMGFRSANLLDWTLNHWSGSGSNLVLAVWEPDHEQSRWDQEGRTLDHARSGWS